jgi:hypothetical protein
VAAGVLDGEDEGGAEEDVPAEHADASTAQQASSAAASALPAIPGVDVMWAVSFGPVGSASRVSIRRRSGQAGWADYPAGFPVCGPAPGHAQAQLMSSAIAMYWQVAAAHTKTWNTS